MHCRCVNVIEVIDHLNSEGIDETTDETHEEKRTRMRPSAGPTIKCVAHYLLYHSRRNFSANVVHAEGEGEGEVRESGREEPTSAE